MALLRAVGYRDAHLRKLLFLEHGWLMQAGLTVGIVSAAVAMIPALFITKTQASPGFLLALLLFIAVCSSVCMTVAVGIAMKGDALAGLRKE